MVVLLPDLYLTVEVLEVMLQQSSEVNYVLVAAGIAGKQTSVVSLEQSHPTANGECQKASLNSPLSLLSQFHYFDSLVSQKFTTSQ